MREIKFRAWDRVGNLGMCSVECIDFLYSKAWFVGNSGGAKVGRIIESECFLMQYTGLKDKNGKEIYEGDIVKKYNEVSELGGYSMLKVQWNIARACFELYNGTPEDYTYLYKTEEKLEIIGNIYENPELLSNTKENHG